jgi:enoyl-CoA hydratase
MNYILIEKNNRVATLTINRPDALNALNTELLKEFSLAWDELQADEEVLVIIITGAGRAFVAGADIAEMADMNLLEGRAFGNTGQNLFRRIEKSEKPAIAAVNGYALGGGLELAMSCDMRIASEYAVFGQPETGLGITPGFSGTQRLAAIVGRGMAMEMILSNDSINAERAAAIGLVNRVVPADSLMTEASALAEKIASKAPLAVRWASSAIKRGMETDIDSGIAIEADLFAMCFATEDQKEGMKAFLEKRPPEFKGK